MRGLETRLAEYRAKREAVIKERKALRQKARAKLETHLLDERIKSLSSEIKALALAASQASKAAREAKRDELRVLNAQRFAAVKDARKIIPGCGGVTITPCAIPMRVLVAGR